MVLAGTVAIATLTGAINRHEQNVSPSAMAIPDGQTVLFSVHAEGVQIYAGARKSDPDFRTEWVLQAPEANLFDNTGNQMGHHYAGPVWEAQDGSRVVGEKIASSPAPHASDVPWLLLKANSSGRGQLAHVSYVMRTDTFGGVPPPHNPFVGQIARVPYKATYLFLGRAKSGENQEEVVLAQTHSATGKSVHGIALSESGFAFGGQFESNSSDGIGILGVANAVTGSTYGGNFQSMSPLGTGVYGVGRSTQGKNFGVYGQTDSQEGVGVKGIALAPIGGTIGVLGSTTSQRDGFGVFSEGKIGSTGPIAVCTDDPTQGSNRYLVHYATVGPQAENVYNGTVTTDDQGGAWVQLPAYFEKINVDFRYQLTIVDGEDSSRFAEAKIAQRIKDNRFKIRTSMPNLAVCWEVKGLRADPFIARYGAPSVIRKPH